jgi:tRNA/rRNA methyltransferase
LATDPVLPPLERLSRVRVVLHSPRHPGNIGAAARAMKTMGLSRLCLVTPERFPDDEAYRRASGARDLIDRVGLYPDLASAVAGCVVAVAVAARPRDHAPVSMPPRMLMPRLLDLAVHGEVALVFGNETNGLARVDVNRCDFLVRIPTGGEYGSLNLGAAVQVLCYELRMAALAAAGEDGARPDDSLDSPLATHEQVVQLLDHAERTLVALDFLVPGRPSRLMERIARLARKARLEQEEVNILRGVLAAAEAARAASGDTPSR